MGGIGSGGRYWRGARATVDDFQSLDVRRWQRDGLLVPGSIFNWQWIAHGNLVSSINVRVEVSCVIFAYRHQSDGDWKNENYAVSLERTPCKFGGRRAWFTCPSNNCGRRVAILYGGAIFTCRVCRQLAYPSQRETADDRAARRANKIRRRLGWKVGIFNAKGWKPKGMHSHTFDKLTREHDTFAAVSFAGMAHWFGIRRRR